jgi:Glycosyl transferase family 2
MPIVDLVLLILGVAAASYALASVMGVVRAVRSVPVLAEAVTPAPAGWPRVSIIIPACNEAAEIEEAVRSRLIDDYPELEIVLVDDRSTDGTAEIVDRLAREDGRVRALHVVELPSGWLGKLFALDRGARAASGELLLFSDADVHVAPGALRRAVALLEDGRLDHLGVLPRFWSSGFFLDAAFSAFFRLVWLAARPWAIPDPRSKAAFGVGAFNLVRRSAFERSPGFEYLKLEQADDAALGQMLKRCGARCAVANGRGDLGLHFYRSLREMARGIEKGGARWPFPAVLAGMAVLLALELGPWLALAASDMRLRALGAVGAMLSIAATVGVARWMRHPVLPAVVAPVGIILLATMMVRASALAVVRGGVSWRGTFYRTEDLRAGSRFQIG